MARTTLGSALILLSLLLGSAAAVMHSLSAIIWLEVPAAALFALSLFTRNPFAVHMAFFTFLMPVSFFIWPRSWPFYLLAPLLPYAGIVMASPPLRRTVYWLKKGTFDRRTVLLIAIAVAGATLGLALWFACLGPDLSMHAAKIPRWSPAMLVAAGIGFGFINAAIEESIYRGLVMECLQSIFGPGSPTIALQAIAFGLVHIRGIPMGYEGVLMATAYGYIQGVIRIRSGGMLAPYLTHVCMDILIFLVLAFRIAGR